MKKSYPAYYSDRSRFSKGQRRAFSYHAGRAIKKARTANKSAMIRDAEYITCRPVNEAWRQW